MGREDDQYNSKINLSELSECEVHCINAFVFSAETYLCGNAWQTCLFSGVFCKNLAPVSQELLLIDR